ncbi:MAG: NarK/NasA family nitrate transporter [Acidobacteria bacterium]|nr:MAG: NarK/NasA family nitrate transporter [Acidobacteriota bacterium]
MESASTRSSPTLALGLATASFALSFAAWGLVGGLAPIFTELYKLNASQTALLVAVPVLLGSLARLPMGMLTDRFGGRLVFTLLLVASSAAAAIVPMTSSYGQMIGAGFALGLAGSSFAIGAAFVSRWTPAGRQGTALGIYGLGTLGQSFAVFGGPVIAAVFGWPRVFQGMSLALIVWASAFFLLARNPPGVARPAGVGAMVRLLRTSPTAWLLGAFYFLTFGGFVAFSIYLPTLLKMQFHLTPADAGFRAAGFVVLATLLRPLGGWLGDRIGGAQVLSWVFAGIAVFSLLLAWPSMVPFTVGALACAVCMGLGNGAVFKLVPEHFPKETGTVTGLVGALGGLGGFFPPLLLGVFRDSFGVVWPGFALLSATALVLRFANRRVFAPADIAWRQALSAGARRASDRVRAAAWGTVATLLLAAAIVVGSRNLAHFDAALIGYTFATLFATFGMTYRYAMWLDRPPTRMYWRRGWQAFFVRRRLGGNAWRLGRRAIVDFAGNRYIFIRGRLRGMAHWLIMWGCVLAAAITFPLVWGWVHFETVPGDVERYRAFVFGVAMQEFPVDSAVAFVLFHGLVWSSFLVIAGVMIAFRRRMTDRGAVATQQFGQDILPLLLLFAISVTGLMLTASYTWLKGYAYEFLAVLHAATVILTLLWLPFGKLFHVFQRPAQLGVGFYRDAGAAEPATCRRCGQPFASAMMVRDLIEVERDLGFTYEMDGQQHYQEICPKCRRALFGLAQGAMWGRS